MPHQHRQLALLNLELEHLAARMLSDVAQIQKDLEKHIQTDLHEHAVQDHAVDIALATLNDRLAGMNEFREQMADSEAKFATKVEMRSLDDKYSLRIDTNAERARVNEVQIGDVRGKLLGHDFVSSVDERFRFLERMVYMASGALTIIFFLVTFFLKR